MPRRTYTQRSSKKNLYKWIPKNIYSGIYAEKKTKKKNLDRQELRKIYGELFTEKHNWKDIHGEI